MEPQELKEQTEELVGDGGTSPLNKAVAVAVVMCAVFMAFCKVKDDNIVQAMQASQVEKLDQWNLYQAKSLKQHMFEVQVENGQVQLATQGGMPPEGKKVLEDKIKKWEGQVKKYDGDKADSRKKAEDSGKLYDKLNFRDDQFDLSDTLLGLAVALFALTTLVKSKTVFSIATVISIFGVIMGLAGFFQWKIHPDVITNFLS